MLAFEIRVNGKLVCVAGTETSDVLSTTIDWVRRSSDNPNDRVQFHVGGIIAGDRHSHFGWSTQKLRMGDEITIRLADVESWDEPEYVYQPNTNPEARDPPSVED